ncbi:MAG: hypothetical protein K8I27_16200 [Planctomycetes bacterium]|nr:hypothetical protein [Planctomycetota bacterium]
MEWIILGIGLLLTLGLALAVARVRWRRHMREMKQWGISLEHMSPVTLDRDLDGLPETAQRLLRHAIGAHARPVRAVRFKQVGEIRPAKDGRWLPCVAEQVLRLPGGFVWRACVKSGLMRLSGGDHYVEGRGGVNFWFWGLFHAVKSRGEDLVKSAAHRALLEAMWFPPALLAGEWREVDTDTARAKLKLDEYELTVDYKLDADGRILEVSGQRWGNQGASGKYELLPFGGIMETEQTIDGYTVPSRFRVGWHFGTAKWGEGEFYRADMKDIEFLE